MYRGSKQRKGQFFIVGAIIIILILYMLSNTLTQSTNINCASVQDNNPVWMIEETEKGLYLVTKKNLTDRNDIDSFIEMQKEVAKENSYNLGFDLSFNAYDTSFFSLYTISLESSKFYILKEDQLIPYYSSCEDGLVCLLDGMGMGYDGYSNACCKAYGLCC